MRQPKHVLVQVLVTVNPDNSFSATVRSYYEDRVLPPDKPLLVQVGDKVAWLVKVRTAAGRNSLPYTVGFTDSRFFGVSSLDVQSGGVSPFLPVRELQAEVRYSLNVTGIGCVFDPDIQSGRDEGPMRETAVAYVVCWDVASNAVTYTTGACSTGQPFPAGGVELIRGDTVTFDAAVTSETVAGFAVTFSDNNNGWATPFDPDRQTFTAAAGTPTVIGPKTVDDPNDAGGKFPFTMRISVNGAPHTFPGAPNVKFTL